MPNYFKQGAVDLAAASAGGGATEVWVPSLVFEAASGTPARLQGHFSVGGLGWALDSASTESIKGQYGVPQDWVTFRADILVNSLGASGDVRMQNIIITQKSELGVTQGAGLAHAVTATVGSAGSVISTPTITREAGTKVLFISITRAGAEAVDTLAEDLVVYGVRLVKLT